MLHILILAQIADHFARTDADRLGQHVGLVERCRIDLVIERREIDPAFRCIGFHGPARRDRRDFTGHDRFDTSPALRRTRGALNLDLAAGRQDAEILLGMPAFVAMHVNAFDRLARFDVFLLI
ncbi:hypothetical protein C6V08_04265 [Burkholderia gladioli]|nr:hypothetical protein XF14_10915 [Burkholderia gladioli]PRH11121.1 hypothetical protein C6V08_04265 [Burkholderia gladioli]